jgi:hypothetical protein
LLVLILRGISGSFAIADGFLTGKRLMEIADIFSMRRGYPEHLGSFVDMMMRV